MTTVTTSDTGNDRQITFQCFLLDFGVSPMQWHETFYYIFFFVISFHSSSTTICSNKTGMRWHLTNRPIHLSKCKKLVRRREGKKFFTSRKREWFVVLVMVRAKNRQTPSVGQCRTHVYSTHLVCDAFFCTGCQIHGTVANVASTKTTTQCSNAKVMTCRSVELSNRLQKKKKSKGDEKHIILKFTRLSVFCCYFGNWNLDQNENKSCSSRPFNKFNKFSIV